MIHLKRSGTDIPLASGDLSFLEYTARGALDRGETVMLKIDGSAWQVVDSYIEVSETLHELYEDLDARRDAQANHETLFGDAS